MQFSPYQERNSYQPYDIKIRYTVIMTSSPEADIIATGCCKYWISDVDIMKHQKTTPNLPQMTLCS